MALFCVGCCWGLMIVLFALGVMSLVWMAVVAALDLRREGTADGDRLTRPIAAVLIALGIWVAVAPQAVPGLTQPDSPAARMMRMNDGPNSSMKGEMTRRPERPYEHGSPEHGRCPTRVSEPLTDRPDGGRTVRQASPLLSRGVRPQPLPPVGIESRKTLERACPIGGCVETSSPAGPAERVHEVDRLGGRAGALERDQLHRLLEPEQRVGEAVRRAAEGGRACVRGDARASAKA